MDARHQQPVATSTYYYHHLPHSYHDPNFASLAYRPLQYQLQLDGLPSTDHHHQHQQQAHLSSLAAAGFQQQNLRLRQHHQHQHQHQDPLRSRQLSRRSRAQMTFNDRQQDATGMSEDELAELQEASNKWEAESTGPLVGERQPSTAITAEYASADPVFQAKTAALPAKYSHYRTVRGDGKCGWRAVAFGYFETLIHLGDDNKFYEELARLRSLSNVCNQAGLDPSIYEDFAEEVYDLLKKLPEALAAGNAEDVLLETFNDDMVQNFIITHLRTLTASWMKTHQNDYAPWLITQTVEQYCNHHIMPVAAEIENVGLTALKDVLLSPAGITLEVLYLDRSEGSEVNMHRFSPVNPGGYDIGTLRLLYRPGHYDLLYMAQDLPPGSVVAPVQTYLQYATQPYQEPVQDLGVSDFMTMIPGMSYANPQQGWMSGSGSYESSDFFVTPAPVQQCPQPLATPVAPAPQPQIQSQPLYTATPTQLVPPPVQFPQELAIRSAPHGSMHSLSAYQHHGDGGPFRPSHWEFEPDFAQKTSSMQFQTAIFRNSHFNTAHFMNPDFQPEEWRPDDDYVTTNSRTAKLRSSG